MREIKFRAWDTVRRTMVYEVEVHSGEQDWWQAYIGTWEVLPASEGILMQYTGLRDKNGVEIYEGDVVRVVHDLTGHVIDGVMEYMPKYLLFAVNRGGRYFDAADFADFEVIGNIYENPELVR